MEVNTVISVGTERARAKTPLDRNHVRTLITIISCSIPWRGERRAPFPEIDWREPEFEVIFSIPQFPEGYVSDYRFDRWYLVSIKPLEAKKEQPKAAKNLMPGAGKSPVFTGPEERAVRLVGVRRSEGGGGHDLLVKFEEVAPQQGREVELSLAGPIGPTGDQTIADVTHTRTILNVMESSVSWTPLPKARCDVTQWREPLFEVVFLMPKDAQGEVSDFSGWSLVSIKMPEAKNQ